MKNIGESFAFIFRDPDWAIKLLIGAIFTLLSFMLVGVPVVYGYCIALLKRVRRGEDHPLPEWKDPGIMFITGIKYLIALLIYTLPAIIIFAPIILLFLMTNLFSSPVHALAGIVALPFVCLIVVLYSLLVLILTPAISICFAEKERIRDAVNIGKVFTLFGQHWQEAIIVTIIDILLSIAACIGILFFIIGIFFTLFYVLLVVFHLYGQMACSLDQQSSPMVQT